jgi:ABC-type polysaccharide/polyol phosphate transport system ATPase subunit
VAVIDAQAVSKQFLLRHNASVELKVRFLGLLHRHHRQSVEEFWALKNVSLQIGHGEGVGLIGRNGSGKSTFLKLIAAIHRPTSGRLLVARGARVSSMIELGVGFHPELTGRENVFLNAAIHGLTALETEAIYDGIVSYSGLAHFIDVPIKNYSSGMYMRLGFAIAANLDPDILLLDEIFAVGDADFQQRCVGTLKGFMDRGRTIVFVSHAAAAVRTICRRSCVLDAGELVFDGDVGKGLAFYDRLLARGTRGPSGAASSRGRGPHAAAGDHDIFSVEPAHIDGDWVFEFLRQQGLDADDRVLHIVNPAVSNTVDWTAFLGEENYVRVTGTAALFEREPEPDAFDVAIADTAFFVVPFNTVARCIATVVQRLRPSGRFYATWFENPDPANFDPIVQADGLVSYPDREPYHYPWDLVVNVCDAVGARVERISDATAAGGVSILAISRSV